MAYVYAARYNPEYFLDAAGRVLPNLPVTVYVFGGTTLATLYADEGKTTPISNPISTDAFGNLTFCVDPGLYTLNVDSNVFDISLPINSLEPSGFPGITIAAYNSSSQDRIVADYICDGMADDVEINAALVTGLPVKMLIGTFNTVSPINHTLDNGILTGSGAGTVIVPSASVDGIHMGTQDATAGLTQTASQVLTDIKVAYARGTQTGIALKILGARDFELDRVYLDGGADSLYLENCGVFNISRVNSVFFTNNGLRLIDNTATASTVTIGNFNNCKLSCDNNNNNALLFDGDASGHVFNRLHFSACRFGNDATKTGTVAVKFNNGTRSTVFTACESRNVVTGFDFTSIADQRCEIVFNGTSFNGLSTGTPTIDMFKFSANNTQDIHLAFEGCQFAAITNAFNITTMKNLRLKFGNNHYTDVTNAFNLGTSGLATDVYVTGEQYGSTTGWITGSGTIRHRTPATFPMPVTPFRDSPSPMWGIEGRLLGSLSDQAISGTGVCRSVLRWFQAGDKVSNVSFIVGATSAGTPTAGFVALYDDSATPTLLGQSADFGTTPRAATTSYTSALTAPVIIPHSGYYWLGISFTASVVPTLYSDDLKTNAISTGVAGQSILCQSHGSALGGTAPSTITSGSVQNKIPYLVAS